MSFFLCIVRNGVIHSFQAKKRTQSASLDQRLRSIQVSIFLSFLTVKLYSSLTCFFPAQQQQTLEEESLSRRWKQNFHKHETVALSLRRQMVKEQQLEMIEAEQEIDTKYTFHPSKSLLELDKQIQVLSKAEQFKDAELIQSEYERLVYSSIYSYFIPSLPLTNIPLHSPHLSLSLFPHLSLISTGSYRTGRV